MKIIRKIILVVICVILVDYIYQYNQFQKYNQAPLIIKTPEGSNQPYHPFRKDGMDINTGWRKLHIP